MKDMAIKVLRQFPYIYQLRSLKKREDIRKAVSTVSGKFEEGCKLPAIQQIEKQVLNRYFRNFLSYVRTEPGRVSIPVAFLESDIYLEKSSFAPVDVALQEPIVVCVIKDDLARVKMFLDHHKSIGVKYFVFVDNMSSDGTFEYIIGCDNVNVYRCRTTYSTTNRDGWINRILAYYGFNRWYLCLDSDELFVYPDMEQTSITAFVELLQKRKLKGVRALMVDMYSDKSIFSEEEVVDIKKEYRFFDNEGYRKRIQFEFDPILGGARERIFSSPGVKLDTSLLKSPLFYLDENIVYGNAHYLFPYKNNREFPFCGVLMHYKFLPGDFEKYRARMLTRSYYNGSAEYNAYVNKYAENSQIAFMHSSSERFENSNSFKQIKIKGETRFFEM